MKRIAGLLLPMSVLLILILMQAPSGVAQPTDRDRVNPKLAAWVFDHTANQQQAEFLVVLSDQADLRGADRLTTKAAKGRYVYETLLAQARKTQQPVIAWLQEHGVEYRSFYIVNAIWVKADRETALALAARRDVARLDGNPPIYNDLVEPEKSIGPQPEHVNSIEPGIVYVHAPEVWNLGYTGQGVVVGGQDTGYLWDHAALKLHYRGWDGITVTHDYNWHDSIHANTHGANSCGANSPVPCDDYGHGTHTMGTVLGDDGGSNRIGMAPGAKWIGCRNMDNGWGSPATYLECFEFFLAPYPITGTVAQGDPAQAPDVTNNSWSCPPAEGCNASSFLEAVQAQRAAGILTVVSASNGSSACSSINDPPSIYDEAYSVGALDTGSDTLASFSNRGPVISDGSNRRKPDIAAPGTATRSSTRDGGYGSMSGTSMASPHVAGAVALLWSARPELRNQITATEQLLDEAAVHIPSTACSSNGWPNNTFGYGRLDIQAALYGVQAPEALSQSADPGHAVTYTIVVTNTGITTDTFSINLGPMNWPSTIAMTSTPPLAAQAGLSTTLVVTIPAQALGHVQDVLRVTIASQTVLHRSAETIITTTAQAVRGARLSPTALVNLGLPGQWVTYTLHLTNTGNLTQTYVLGLAGTRPGWLEPYSTTLPVGSAQDVLAAIFLPPYSLESATSYVLVWYETFTDTLAAYSRLDTRVIVQQLYLPVILK